MVCSFQCEIDSYLNFLAYVCLCTVSAAAILHTTADCYNNNNNKDVLGALYNSLNALTTIYS